MSHRNEIRGIILGCLSTLGINILVVVLLIIIWYLFAVIGKNAVSFLSLIPPLILLGNFYLLQLVYLLPLLIFLILKKRWYFMLGVISGALITYFLNIVLGVLVLSKMIGL